MRTVRHARAKKERNVRVIPTVLYTLIAFEMGAIAFLQWRPW